jgi:AcrR family transcriptional regulator
MSATRTRLLEAGMNAFAAHGFTATTMRDIAGRADLTPGTLYVHFASKEDLLFQISLVGHEGALRELRSATTGDPAASFDAGVYALALWHAVNHQRARVVNYELSALDEEHRARILELRRAIFDHLRSLVQALADGGADLIDDVDRTTMSVMSLCVDISRWFDPAKPWTSDQVARSTQRAAARLVGHDVGQPARSA